MKNCFLPLLLSSFMFYSFGQIKESQSIDNIFMEWDKPNTPGAAIGIIKMVILFILMDMELVT